jgi:hypothetical protein
MERLIGARLFAGPKVARKRKARLERAKLVIATRACGRDGAAICSAALNDASYCVAEAALGREVAREATVTPFATRRLEAALTPQRSLSARAAAAVAAVVLAMVGL